MAGFESQPFARAASLGALVLLALTVAAGCGSDGGSTSVEAGSPADTTPRPEAKAPAATTSPTSGRGHDRSNSNGKTGDAADQQPSRPAGTSHRRAAGTSHRRAAEACPDGLTHAQCKSLVAEIKQQMSSGSPSLNDPHDCLDVMSRAECEAMLAAQQAAMRAAGHPIVLKECLAHPTPECKAALESVLEAQYAASRKASR